METKLKNEAEETSQEEQLDDVEIFGSKKSWFQSLSRTDKRFHILFYALVTLLGAVAIQLVWQIAVFTAR